MALEEDEVKEAEVVSETALIKIQNDEDMKSLVKPQEQTFLRVMDSVENLDWRHLKPNQAALLLMAKPFPITGGVTYLNLKQALLFAVRAYELGLSPFSDNVWFDPNRGVVNLTLSGKREVARLRGIDLGPPQFEEVSREWNAIPKMTEAAEAAKKSGFSKDVGMKCRIRVGDVKNQEFSEFTAWASEWYVSRSPVWASKPLHMLSIRAQEKAITFALGTGASAMPDEKEIE